MTSETVRQSDSQHRFLLARPPLRQILRGRLRHFLLAAASICNTLTTRSTNGFARLGRSFKLPEPQQWAGRRRAQLGRSQPALLTPQIKHETWSLYPISDRSKIGWQAPTGLIVQNLSKLSTTTFEIMCRKEASGVAPVTVLFAACLRGTQLSGNLRVYRPSVK